MPLSERAKAILAEYLDENYERATGWYSDHRFAIARKIRKALEEQEMSQSDLAQKLGKTEEEIRAICGAQQNLSLKAIAKIGDALGVKLISDE